MAGDPFEPELAAAAAGVAEPAALDGLDELLRRDLVRHTDVPRRFRFRHPLVRRAVYEAAPGRLAARRPRGQRARRSPRAARPPWPAPTTSSARPGTATPPPPRVLREAARGDRLRARPATAARLLDAPCGSLRPDAPERAGLLAASAHAHAAAGQFREAHDAPAREPAAVPPAETGAPRAARRRRARGSRTCSATTSEAHARLTGALGGSPTRRRRDAVVLMRELAGDGFYRMDYGAMCDWAAAPRRPRPLGDRALRASRRGDARARAERSAARSREAEPTRTRPRRSSTGCPTTTSPTTSTSPSTRSPPRRRCSTTTAGRARTSSESLRIARATGQGHVLPILLLGRHDPDDARTAGRCGRGARHRRRDRAGLRPQEGLAWNLFARSLDRDRRRRRGDARSAPPRRRRRAARPGPQPSRPRAPAWRWRPRCSRRASRTPPWRRSMLRAGGERARVLPALRGDRRLRAADALLDRAAGDGEAARRVAARAEAADALGLPLAGAFADRAAAALALASRRPPARRPTARCPPPSRPRRPARSSRRRSRARWRAAPCAGAASPRAAPGELERAAAAFHACGAPRSGAAVERELGRLGRRRHRRTRPGRADGDGSARSPSASSRSPGSWSTGGPTPRSRPRCS